MERRDFVTVSAGALAAALAPAGWMPAAPARLRAALAPFDAYATQLVHGFVRAARRTAPGYAVCDFPDGTLVASCVAPSGHTYVSVARMLPLLAEWLAAGRDPIVEVDGARISLADVVYDVYRHAFDPAHPQFWGMARTDKPEQRAVEAALVADALHRIGDPLLSRLSTAERANVQRWLAGCTVVPERANNHAWFHCLNQAVRLQLAERWPEFSGDEQWMLDDLQAMAALAPDDDGWYSDSPDIAIYDYYNFWTFANFPLLWSRVAGARYPVWRDLFQRRARRFLERAPLFVAADGSNPWMGRSLLYRWATLSPMLLGYRQGIWPHGPGLLRRIVRLTLEYHHGIGAFDAARGKLRETLSADGTRDVREGYIDNGSPYWSNLGMLFLYDIPMSDPFWTAPEEPLPVERADFVERFAGPRMLVAGTQATGEVRWLQARNAPKFLRYRDKYAKFVASSHFPFNVLAGERQATWDQALVVRDPATGTSVARVGVTDGELLADGVRTRWWTELSALRIEVESVVRLLGEFEERTHVIRAPADAALAALELVEGSHALGLADGEEPAVERGDDWLLLRSPARGHGVACWVLAGYATRPHVARTFDDAATARTNLIHPHVAVATLRAPARLGTTYATLHYASPAPRPLAQLHARAATLRAAWTATQRDGRVR